MVTLNESGNFDIITPYPDETDMSDHLDIVHDSAWIMTEEADYV